MDHKDAINRIGKFFSDHDRKEINECLKKTSEIHSITYKKVLSSILNVIEKGNPTCHNRTSVQGWGIEKYSPSKLFHIQDQDKTYCFLNSDVSFLSQGKNPFNGRPLAKDLSWITSKAKQKKLFDPYGQVLPKGIPEVCPLFVSSDPKILYSYSCVGFTYGYKSLAPGQQYDGNCVGNVLKLTLERPLVDKDVSWGFPDITTKLITSKEVVLNTLSLEPPRPKADRKLKSPLAKLYKVYIPSEMSTFEYDLEDVLREFMGESGVVIPKDAIQDILKQKIRPKTPVVVYRGIKWYETHRLDRVKSFKEWMKTQKRKSIAVGDIINIEDDRPASWSSNVCVAASFAVSGERGIVFKYTVNPEEILIDTRMLKNRNMFYGQDQGELILLPGDRKVQVELLSWNSSIITPGGVRLNEKPTEQFNFWVKELKVEH